MIVPGRGLKCNVIGTEVLVGNAMWMEDNSLSPPRNHSFGKYEDQGKTAVYVAIDDEIGKRPTSSDRFQLLTLMFFGSWSDRFVGQDKS